MTRLGVALVLGILSSSARAEPPLVDASPSAASAEPPAPVPPPDPALVVQYTRIARDAARVGNCDTARETLEALRAIDPSHDARPVDPAVALCLGTNLVHARYLRAAHEAAVAGRCAHVRDVVELMRLEGLDAKAVVSTPVLACLVARPREVTADPPDSVPPLSLSRIVGGIAVGTVFAIPGLYVGLYAGAVLSPVRSLEAAIWSAYAGGVLGVTFGVYAVGVVGNQTGSFGATLAGALVGGVAGIVLTYSADGAGALAALVTPYVGALAGFHLTRRYESRAIPRVGSLVTRTNDRWSLGIPLVVHAEHATTFSLVSGSF